MKALFNQKITVKSITLVDDDAMGHTETEVVVVENLPCKIDWKRGQQRLYMDKETYIRDAVIYTAYRTDITSECIVYIGDDKFEIVDVVDKNVARTHRHLELTVHRAQ